MAQLRLSLKERDRGEVLSKVAKSSISLRQASELLGVSYRQVLRVWKRYQLDGASGLKHGLRDRVSNRQFDETRRERVLEVLGGDIELNAQGRGAAHRQWRERRACWGEMIQMDGSNHDWFEGRRGRASLMVLIDDATNWTHAKFFESETTAAAMTVFGEYVGHYGLPRALYVDRAGIYETTRDSTVDEALRDAAPLTQFGRAMRDLGVELILAHSPQAKGRVERRHAVFQDRFVKALRLQQINTLESANEFLDHVYLDELNHQFHVTARSLANLHRPLPRGLKLDHVLCHQEERVVQNDWTVSWCNRIVQLSVVHQTLSLARKKITVSELLDGTLRLTFGTQTLSWTEVSTRPLKAKPKPQPPVAIKPPYKPAANHPWRRGQ